MVVKHLDLSQQSIDQSMRPQNFTNFIGQDYIKRLLGDAVISAQKRKKPLGHILLSGPSGFGKTSLASIVASMLDAQFFSVTGYAIAKPSDIMSLLTQLNEGDVLFIDEIHRIKPVIEELLYIAMEDFVIDLVMPEGGSMKVPLKPFTLIGATTMRDKLSEPLKNRFIYDCQFLGYDTDQKYSILSYYIKLYDIAYEEEVLYAVAEFVEPVPRLIHGFVIKIRDWMIANSIALLTCVTRGQCRIWMNIDTGGLTHLHQLYLSILSGADRPLGLRTIAMQMGINEASIETDIEPLLFRLGKIDKTPRGRVLLTSL